MTPSEETMPENTQNTTPKPTLQGTGGMILPETPKK